MRIVTLLVLTALINGTFLTECAGLRVQHHTRFQPTTLNQSADPLWEAVFAVPVGSPLHVELGTRDLIRGRFRSADEQTLVLVEDGNLRSVPRAESLVCFWIARHPCQERCSVGTRYRSRHVCHIDC